MVQPELQICIALLDQLFVFSASFFAATASPPTSPPASAIPLLCPVLQVLPELQDAAVNERPILKADALKFVTTFRSQLPQQTLLALLQPCTALLASEAVVVHSYAATAIERFLALREGGRLK
jgi:hypothetical protein